jgi:hypothetical protein
MFLGHLRLKSVVHYAELSCAASKRMDSEFANQQNRNGYSSDIRHEFSYCLNNLSLTSLFDCSAEVEPTGMSRKWDSVV